MKSLILILSASILLSSCLKTEQSQSNEEEVIADFLIRFNQFYETYARADIDFIDYYTHDVVTIDTNGKITKGSEVYRDAWTENFRNYEIDLLEYTKPGIVFSQDQIVTYNDYDELFIHKETRDTTRVQGTWIGVWQKIDNQWMVKMNTFHIRDQTE